MTSAAEFERSVLQIREAYTKSQEDEDRFLNSMYYFLGWLVGDTGKNFSPTRPWARIQLDLSKKHPENLALGNSVMSCISSLGIKCGRIADGPPRKRDSYGLFRWMSYFSEVFVWFHTSCLGLGKDQLTSYDPVKVRWLLTGHRERIVWFLRGIADSDGTVNIRNKTVEITSEPNAQVFRELFEQLGIHTTVHKSKGVEVLSLSVSDAYRVKISSPAVETHRSRLLLRLATARTFQSRWPVWLETRVTQYLQEGLDEVALRNRLLFQDNVYVKLSTLKKKNARMHSGAGGGPSAC